jgi:hypothetical protein
METLMVQTEKESRLGFGATPLDTFKIAQSTTHECL